MGEKNIIYHIVTHNDLKTQTKDDYYKPSIFEEDGFIHCTAEKSTSLLVLEDYFVEISKNNEILILVFRPHNYKLNIFIYNICSLINLWSKYLSTLLFCHLFFVFIDYF